MSASPTLDTPANAAPNPLQAILALDGLSTHYQPIVSVKRKALIGVEALVRAADPRTGLAVPPPRLFEWARESGRLLDLDRACQRSAMQGFATLPQRDPELLLFINIEASLLDAQPGLSLFDLVHERGVKPSNVVIEVNETQVQDSSRLTEFVQRHRQQGFLIAMDDLGTGHSGLQRWPLLKPDIIKLDRSIVDGVAGSFFARELLRSLIALGRQTGALVLAEGIETQADVDACLDLGVDLFQGYYFARPAAAGAPNLDQALSKAWDCATAQKDRALHRMAERRGDFLRHSQTARNLAFSLMQMPVDLFDTVMRLMPGAADLESATVLDERGVQLTSTVFPGRAAVNSRASLFQPSKPGADHSDRDYFYGLAEAGNGRDFFLTEAHVSVATGQLCRTLSFLFQHPSGSSFVICLDLRQDEAAL